MFMVTYIQGGKLSRVLNCVLALKSYGEWKKAGAHGTFKFEGNPKPSPERKQMVVNTLDMAKCGDLWKDVEDKVSTVSFLYAQTMQYVKPSKQFESLRCL